MENGIHTPIAIVGVGAILPDAPNAATFWDNVKSGRYSITEVTPDRWDPALYYDPDPSAPDKSYSKIGGWVREYTWDPMKWHMPIPPRVAQAMDEAQKWGIACTREVLEDYGYPKRPLDLERTAVILGNAMAGEHHYMTALRLYFPEYARELDATSSFASLPEGLRRTITKELHDRVNHFLPEVTEDTMPGELSNCLAGRIANLFNTRGPNFIVDAACASAMAAMTAAAQGLVENQFDVAITGGIDRNMGASTFIKFCKIGALSGTGTRPYAEGADGFVMGEGAAVFLLKRLPDTERDGDKVYAVLRGIAGSSDGKGKGITAPNPIGQKLCMERAWKNAGVSPSTATLIEGHGTSTRVGDVVEVQSISEVLSSHQLPPHSVALGSVKSNFGHLKGAAGAAGVLKTIFALRDKVLPPSVHCERPNPDIDFAHSPLYVNTELREWSPSHGSPRRAGVSAFGFGGTNFHAVFEEYIPGHFNNGSRKSAVVTVPDAIPTESVATAKRVSSDGVPKRPLRGVCLVGADSTEALIERVRRIQKAAAAGDVSEPSAPSEFDLRAPERVVIDYGDAAELATKATAAIKALTANQAAMWKALRAQGIFRGHGPRPKVAFLYTGQGSQYVNMVRALRDREPIIAQTFAEADAVMAPILGKPVTDYIFVDGTDGAAVEQAEADLRQTAITQPAVLAIDIGMTRLLAAYGIEPDMAMGHSLGEYGALVASGALPFSEALEAVAARGREMTRVSMDDNGAMAAVFAPIADVEHILRTVHGYVVIANVNSKSQAVIGGATKAVEDAIQAFLQAGFNAVPLPVSHAFHTSIVAPASEPLRHMLLRLTFQPPRIPVIANVTGQFYADGPGSVARMIDILARQVASPVQFITGLQTLYAAGARVFIEVGPKKALQGFADDVLGGDPEVLSLFTNHPKFADDVAFNQALSGLYAAGLGRGTDAHASQRPSEISVNAEHVVDASERRLHHRESQPPFEAVVITGAALGLPGTEHIFDDGNLARILNGEQLIDVIPTRFRQAMLDKHITRLVKSDNGGATFESIESMSDVIKLAGRGREFDLAKEFGISTDRVPSLDRNTQLAIAVGIDALRDAGIPLIMRYKATTKGTQLPDRWGLADALRDDTGVIFASVFAGYNAFADEMARYYDDRARRDKVALLESLQDRAASMNGDSVMIQEIRRRIDDLKESIAKSPYGLDRRFLLRALSMGHSQFADVIGARGPNTQLNAACATTTQSISVAEDWIRTGRCRRVVIVSADDITTDQLIDWFGAAFLASGAAATDEVVEEAAVPFDRRRHGMIMGMGAAAIVVESAAAARERGIQPICEVLSTATANSAFHATRLSIDHIKQVMEKVVSDAESRAGIHRDEFASKLMFVSHETYTPARGGSASAEIHALRHIFGEHADDIVIANTKGFTGHAMGTGIEDVVAVKALETGCVPPVANFKEVDPELGSLNLSKGGLYPIEYALRLGAGFGSQISMALMRWVRTKDGARRSATKLGYEYRIADKNAWSEWLSTVAGVATPQLEVVQRTLRVRDERMAKAAKLTAAKPEPAAAPTPRIEVPAIQSPHIGRKSATATKPNLPPVNAAAVSQAPAEQETDVVQSASVKERILSLVAEKTGYPPDMLDLDLDLEADLGVDTVKQAEVFAAVREIYKIPRDPNLKLRDFPTLAHVIQFVKDRRADVAAAETVPAPAEESEPVVVETVAAPPAHVVEVAGDEVKKRILALVVEKTGYPEDMLDLDLDLEADLGVDTVKQAEMFAAIRETYNIPRDPNLKLRDFPTLAHVIQFVHDRRPDIVSLAPPSTPTLTEPPPATPVPVEPLAELADDAVKKRILTLVVDKTGYPEDMLDLDLDLEADLGVDTVKQAEMFAAIRETYNIPRDTNLKLRDFPTLAHVIRFVYERRPDLAPAQAPITEKKFVAEVSLPTPAPQQELNDKAIREKILDIVAAKTGYPKDMLDLDLDLEADLGIDTVKQAEMFAEVRAAYNIPRDPNLKLRDFPTLALVIKFARDRAGLMDKPQAALAAIPVTTNSEPQPKAQCLAAATFEAANRVPRRVPLPTPRPPLSICKKTGVKLEPGQRVVIMPDTHGVATELADLLRQRGAQVLMLDPKQSIDPQLKVWLTEGPVEGVYWLPALDQETDLCGMELATWREALRLRVKSLATTMRLLYEQIATPGTFLVCASRLGGKHGYDALGAIAPLGGAVVGFAKAYKRERSEALVKVVDFAADAAASKIARSIVDETLLDPGAIEIGYKSGARWTITLTEDPPSSTATGMPLDRQSVFVVTGAAGSIVSAIIADLAAASGGTFYLLDLIAEPKADNPDLKRFVNDKEGLKRDLFARIQSRAERATPALVERELAALERQQAAASAIEAVRASGGTAHYFSLDLRQPNAVADVISRIKSTHGRIDVLIHAAGLERSHSLPDKDEKEFDLVFDVKADGWFNLLRAIGDMPLGATVAFSSIAGRFGNAGQTDYSSANDLLCKLTSSLRRTRPGTRGIAIDWTAWEGIGMASRGSIPKVMEMAGIDMLPPESGVPMVRRELTMNDRQGEVVIANRLGVLMNELDPSGGVDGDAAGRELRTGPMIGRIAKVGIYDGLTIETTLDPSIQPFLYDHKIDGTPVLPGVMGIEAFTEAALCLLPGWHIDALEDVNFLAPFKFYRNEPRTLKLKVSFTPVNEHLVARCMLVGERTLPTSNAPQITTHFTGTLHLARSVSELQLAPFKRPTGPSISAEDIYKIYFHGPAYRVLSQVWLDHDLALGKMAEHLPPNHVPSTMNLVSSPRLIELCFQTAGLWEIEDQKRLGLPLHIGRIRITPDAEEAAKLYAQITRGALAGTFDAHVLTEHGKCLLQMEGYQTVSLPGSVNVGLLEPLHAEAV